jgi:two-component system, LytTR family, response regulator
MIKAVIIDDEQNNLDNLSRLLEKYFPDTAVVGTALNAEDGRSLILAQRPDLLFLDIQMPDKNGFELLQSLPEPSFELIFVTAFDQYGIQAVKFSAIDYLLKPIDIEEFGAAVRKAIAKCALKKQNLPLENLLQLLQQRHQKEAHRIALATAKEVRFVRPQEIVRCESSNNYTTFNLVTGEKLLVSRPIFEFEELLQDYGFLRCHQSHLVNKEFIRSWLKEDGDFLLLEDGARLPVSRQKKEYLKALFR